MPVSFSYIGDGGILVKSEGDVKGREIKEINDIIYESAEKTKGISYQICDFQNASNVSISQTDVRQIARQDKKAFEINPEMLIAIVTSTDLGFGLSRMWESLANGSPFETKVFRNLKEAQHWIRENLKKTAGGK